MIYKSGIPSKRINIINDAKTVAKWFVQFIAKEKQKVSCWASETYKRTGFPLK